MSTVTVRTGTLIVVFLDARAVLVESQRSEHVPIDGGLYLRVVTREARWTITSPDRIDGWIGGCTKRSWAGGSVWEYGINADLVDEVTVEA